MNFLGAIGIKEPTWTEVGNHLGSLVKGWLDEHNRSRQQLAGYLRIAGHRLMKDEFIDEYLDTATAIGCFFLPTIRFLEIPPELLFHNAPGQNYPGYYEQLVHYLTELGPHCLIGLLTVPPGKQLRDHAASVFQKARTEILSEPLQTLTLDQGALESHPELRAKLDRMFSPNRAKQLELPITQDSGTRQLAINLRAMLESDQSLQETRLVVASNPFLSGAYIPNAPRETRLVVTPYMIRGKQGYTVDLLPSEAIVDANIVESVREFQYEAAEGDKMTLILWNEVYKSGALDKLRDWHNINDLCLCTGVPVDQLVPTRDPTPAERYEIHEKWRAQGGWGRPGVHASQLEALERGEIPKPVIPTEETVYMVNSNLALSIGLFNHITDLVREKQPSYLMPTSAQNKPQLPKP